MYLNEKKNKRIVQDSQYWDLDPELCAKFKMDYDFIKSDP